MITLTAEIEIKKNKTVYLSSNSNPSFAQWANSLELVLNKSIENEDIFILGVSKLGYNSLADRVNYFVSKVYSNKDTGYFDDIVSFTLKFTRSVEDNKASDNLTIVFDTVNNQHPNIIRINGIEYRDDDAIFTVTIDDSITEHTIEIVDWNVKGAPVVIRGIYSGVKIIVDKTNGLSLKRSIFDRENLALPSYGILSNVGKIEFNDKNGEIADYAESNILASDLIVRLKLNNTLSKTYEEIGTFETNDWDYDSYNRLTSVNLKDDLEEWQDISIDGFEYDPRNRYLVLANGTMADLYKWLWKATPSKYQMLLFDDLDEKTKQILNSTKIDYPFLKKATLWRQWQKLCEVCGLYIYKNNKGKTVCIYTLGS